MTLDIPVERVVAFLDFVIQRHVAAVPVFKSAVQEYRFLNVAWHYFEIIGVDVVCQPVPELRDILCAHGKEQGGGHIQAWMKQVADR